jgi:hypothetical protein
VPAIGIGMGWLGYAGVLWGWCLLRGYDVPLGALLSPTHPYGSAKGQSWPPSLLPDTQVFPSSSKAALAAKTNAKPTTRLA